MLVTDRSFIIPRDLPTEAKRRLAGYVLQLPSGRFYRLTLFLAIRQTREFCGHRRRAESSPRELPSLPSLGEKSSGADRPFESDRNNDRQGGEVIALSNLRCFIRYWTKMKRFVRNLGASKEFRNESVPEILVSIQELMVFKRRKFSSALGGSKVSILGF